MNIIFSVDVKRFFTSVKLIHNNSVNQNNIPNLKFQKYYLI